MAKKHGNLDVPEIKKKGLTIFVKDNDINTALRKLKKKVTNEGLVKELKKREHYEKPSVKRRRRKIEARLRWLKKQRELERLS